MMKGIFALRKQSNNYEKADHGAFLSAASKGDDATIEECIHQGININETDINGQTALHLAAKNGHATMVLLLLEKGADLTQLISRVVPLYIWPLIIIVIKSNLCC